MEYSMTSLQFENFSTAELSPPISPAPSSPSLYNHGGLSPNYVASGKEVLKNDGNEFLPRSGAQAATNFLRDLEQFNSFEYASQNELGLNWTEDSVNLELFTELSDLDYVSPHTPVSEEFANQDNLSQFSEAASSLPASPIDHSAMSPEAFETLSAEFQAILASLPPNVGSPGAPEFEDLLAISGIPIPEYQNTQNIPINSPVANDSSAFMEVDLTGEDFSEIICLEENSQSQTGSIYYQTEGENIRVSYETLEDNSDAAEKILDALLLGNLSEAQSFLPDISTLPIDSNIMTIYSNPTIMPAAPVISNNSIVLPVASTSGIMKKQQTKPKSKGRKAKPTEGRKRGLSAIADKSLRKKEQNKTAATRYRLKKKMETVVTSEVESTMQKANDVLQVESNDLARQISIVKQLLRDIREAKKLSQISNIRKRVL